VDPLHQLLLALPAGDEPLRAEQHREDEDEAEDEELEALDLPGEARVVAVRLVHRPAALAEAGELRGLRPEDVVEIGAVVAGRAPGRTSPGERTIFKSVGNAIQDLAVASAVYDRSRELGLGEEVSFP